MRLRRRPNPETVRLTQQGMPTVPIDFSAEAGRVLVQHRRAMLQAIYQIDAGETATARHTLLVALSERWWK